MYAYFSRKLRPLVVVGSGLTAATVILVSAVTGSGGHVAVWMGVSSDNGRNWLQAGIEKTAGLKVAEYIEVGRRGRQISLRTWPTEFGHEAQIVLRHRGNLWRIRIDGHRSAWTWLPRGHVNRLALLETYRAGGAAHGVAVINERQVRG